MKRFQECLWLITIVLTFYVIVSHNQSAVPTAYAQSIQNRQTYGSIKTPAPPPLAWTQRFDYDVNGNTIYSGLAESGNSGGPATSSAVWTIQKFTYDSNGHVTLIQWANGSTLNNNIWDNRASLSYQ